MPELPEVETTKKGIEPHVKGVVVNKVTVRERQLRWPIPANLIRELAGERITALRRRGKYLLLETGKGTLMIHLGMSGNLRIVNTGTKAVKHDHVDFILNNGKVLRFHDPRKFGCVLWLKEDPLEHPLLAKLGPEPLQEEFGIDYLYPLSRKRKLAVKSFIMDSQVVVGVGNIYANEALFLAGIHPRRAAGSVSRARYESLIRAIKKVLAEAIRQGGTTLRDFVGGDGKPGYFKQSLHVYGRAGLPCVTCGSVLKEIRLGQRSTVFCGQCQR